jgi:hypothetical protein
LKSRCDRRAAAITRNPVMRSFEEKMSFKLLMRRFVMAFVVGGYSVLGIGMSREKIESLMHAMNQSHVELSVPDGDNRDDPKGP